MRESRTSGSVRGDGASRTPTSTPAVNKHTTEAFSIKYVGLDVHKETIAVAVADSGTAEPRALGIIPNDTDALRALVKKLGRPSELRVCYEAGPCGAAQLRRFVRLLPRQIEIRTASLANGLHRILQSAQNGVLRFRLCHSDLDRIGSLGTTKRAEPTHVSPCTWCGTVLH